MAESDKKDVIVIHTFDATRGKMASIYDHDTFPADILERIRELRHELSWREVAYADVRCCQSRFAEREEALERALLHEGDVEIPASYLVKVSCSYPGRYRDVCRRLVRVTCSCRGAYDTVQHYYESSLPVGILPRVPDADYFTALYGDLSEDKDDDPRAVRAAFSLRTRQLQAALFQGRVELQGRDKDVIVRDLRFTLA
jgi:hypothetical protein